MDCIAPDVQTPDRPRFAICTRQTLTLALTLSSLPSRASRHLHDHLKFDNSSPQSNHPPRAQGYEGIANSSPHILLLAASYLSCRSALESTGFPFGRSCREAIRTEGTQRSRQKTPGTAHQLLLQTSKDIPIADQHPARWHRSSGRLSHRQYGTRGGPRLCGETNPPARALSFDLSFMTETQRKHLPFFRPASRTFTV
jgi:hypothetical protein